MAWCKHYKPVVEGVVSPAGRLMRWALACHPAEGSFSTGVILSDEVAAATEESKDPYTIDAVWVV